MDGDFKKEVIDQSIEDIRVEFDEEFDRNFERKAFFDEKEWPERKFDDGVGSLLQRTGGLRRSVGAGNGGANWFIRLPNHTPGFIMKAGKYVLPGR